MDGEVYNRREIAYGISELWFAGFFDMFGLLKKT